MEDPFGHCESAVLVTTPSHFFCTHSLLAGRPVWEAEAALTLHKDCSAITKMWVGYQHSFDHIPKTFHLNGLLWRKLMPYQPDPGKLCWKTNTAGCLWSTLSKTSWHKGLRVKVSIVKYQTVLELILTVGQGTEYWRQLWLKCLWSGRVQDPERRKQGK